MTDVFDNSVLFCGCEIPFYFEMIYFLSRSNCDLPTTLVPRSLPDGTDSRLLSSSECFMVFQTNLWLQQLRDGRENWQVLFVGGEVGRQYPNFAPILYFAYFRRLIQDSDFFIAPGETLPGCEVLSVVIELLFLVALLFLVSLLNVLVRAEGDLRIEEGLKIQAGGVQGCLGVHANFVADQQVSHVVVRLLRSFRLVVRVSDYFWLLRGIVRPQLELPVDHVHVPTRGVVHLLFSLALS